MDVEDAREEEEEEVVGAPVEERDIEAVDAVREFMEEERLLPEGAVAAEEEEGG